MEEACQQAPSMGDAFEETEGRVGMRSSTSDLAQMARVLAAGLERARSSCGNRPSSGIRSNNAPEKSPPLAELTEKGPAP